MPPAFGFQSGRRCGAGRRVLDAVLAQPRVGRVHVADDDRDVLEPAVVAARVGRHRPAARRQVLGQLELLVAEPQPDDPQRARRRRPAAARTSRPAPRRPTPSRTSARGVEGDRRGPCRRRSCRRCRPPSTTRRRRRVGRRRAPRASAEQQRSARDAAARAADAALMRSASSRTRRSRAPSRSSRWSPTRSALAMIVSAGFTAPLDGKKLPSTT